MRAKNRRLAGIIIYCRKNSIFILHQRFGWIDSEELHDDAVEKIKRGNLNQNQQRREPQTERQADRHRHQELSLKRLLHDHGGQASYRRHAG